MSHRESTGNNLESVCHVTTVHSPFDDRIFHRECLSLAQAGYHTYLLAPCDHDQIVQSVDIRALPVPTSRWLRILAWPWIAFNRVRHLHPKPALVHLHDPELLLTAQAYRAMGMRVIYDVHENVADQILTKTYLIKPLRPVLSCIYRLLEKLLLRGVATVHVLGSIADRYQGHKVVLHNMPRRSRKLPQGERSGRPRMIYAGGITRDRGALTMIELAQHLQQRCVEVELHLVGQVGEPGLQKLMRERIEANGLASLVRMTGQVSYEQALAEISRADIGLCLLCPTPNYLNSMPIKIIEYMQAGLAVVASNFDCWRQYVSDVGSGLLVDQDDVPKIADAVAGLVANPTAMGKMGQAGVRAVQTQFSWEAEEPKLLGFYRLLLQPVQRHTDRIG